MPKNQPRDGNHHFVLTDDAVARDARAAELRAQGWTYQAIADELGYYDKSHAWRQLQNARKRILKPALEQLIATEMQQLDELYVAALEILEREHVAISQGKIMKDDDGTPILDDGPRLAAIREMRMIRESFRKLHGLDAEKKVNVSGGVRYEIVGIDQADLS
ncbi:hypothetical protein ACFWG6_30905 [Streptomyces erythrochromogenes]|uniref:hypothetical protein n=1 Tax=Streptomyces erythrochromogenes TaxID=285574 RepID=UPI0036317A2E